MDNSLKHRIWIKLKTFYWENISSIDKKWVKCEQAYPPSFYKIYSSEEIEELIEEERKGWERIYALLDELGEWEESLESQND